MPAQALKVHSDDTIIVALQDLEANTTVTVGNQTYPIAELIPHKHKFAAKDFAAGDVMIMYGVPVGTATEDIPLGHAITTQNTKHTSADFDSANSNFVWQSPEHERWNNATFDGYLRPNGDVGTANYWIVVPLVFCENRNLDCMRDAMLDALGYSVHDPYKTICR